MSSRPAAILHQYQFELILVGVELLACLLVALVLFKLFWPAISHAQIASAQTNRSRPIRLTPLAPLQSQDSADEPVGIYVTMHALPVPTATPTGLSRHPVLATGSQTNLVPSEVASPLHDWPVRGRLSQGFGCSSYYSGVPGTDCPPAQPWFHDGLDLAAGSGTPVRAALTGTVCFAGADGNGPPCGDYRGYGLSVVIDSDQGWQALYAHLSELKVTVGQAVSPETIIGTVGATGCVSGSHLHFGLRQHGVLVDPVLYMPALSEE